MAVDYNALIYPITEALTEPPVNNSAKANPEDVIVAIAGATVTIMHTVIQSSDGKWDHTDADASATTDGLIGVALTGAANDGDSFIVVTKGYIRYDTFAWTAADVLWLHTTPGEMVAAKPAGGDFARRVANAITDDYIYFHGNAHTETV